MLVKDAMQPGVVHIHPAVTLHEAAEKMLAHGVDTLFVMDDGRLLGVIGLRDLFTTPVSASRGGRMSDWRSEQQLAEAWQRQTVENVMNEQVLTVSDDLPLLRTASLMVNSGKHPLPVTRDGEIVGVIGRMDIVRALLAHARPVAAGEDQAEP